MANVKKLITSLSVLVLFLVLSAAAVFAAGSKGTVTGDTVNVRTKPDISSKIVIQISKGTVVDVTEEDGDWCSISYNDATGWVSRQFITVSEKTVGTGTLRGDNVNVRSKADIDSDVIARLDKGTAVEVVKISGDWYRIKLGDDRYGWVKKDFVTLRENPASRGVTDEISSPADTDNITDSSDDSAPTVDENTDDSSDTDDKDVRQQIVSYAKRFLGVRYKYGGTTPKGFDCSGFVQYVFKHFDIELERTSTDQSQNGTKIKKSELEPGDIVFFDTNGGLNAVEHAGIYIGGGKFIHASSGSAHKVTISDINEGFYDKCYMWARRYIEE